MTRLEVIRHTFTNKSTIGDLFINGKFVCNTLEDCDRHLEEGGKKIYGETAIPCGEYRIKWTYSPKYGRRMPELLNVPQYQGVRIHSGNKPEDTEGCILCGTKTDTKADWITNSRNAINLVYSLIDSDENLTIKITRKCKWM